MGHEEVRLFYSTRPLVPSDGMDFFYVLLYNNNDSEACEAYSRSLRVILPRRVRKVPDGTLHTARKNRNGVLKTDG